jgi:peptidoglycan/LPS O-acetylase OafA/YrhL
MNKKFRVNNFDLIRLIAALQVAVVHASTHLEILGLQEEILIILSYFPGVPIFFFISGFLISKSYENNPVLNEYASNRMLRIYPALIVCTIFSLIVVYVTGYIPNKNVELLEVIVWFVGQVSIVQFYNPEFLREFGVGVINGSLWTISVELQFYVFIPVVYYLLKYKIKEKNINRSLIYMIIVFMMFHFAKYRYESVYSEDIIFKVYSVTFIPWIWMFLVGVLFQRNFELLFRMLSGKAIHVLLLYLVTTYISTTYFGLRLGNGINPLLYLFLSVLIFSTAYTFPSLSYKILGRNDISYGVYIYHMPVVNVMIYYGYTADLMYLAILISFTIVLSAISWVVFERNSMKLKKHPLNPLNKLR